MTESEDKARGRAAFVEAFGARVSAWLIGKHRAAFRARGVCRFVVPFTPSKEEAPRLFWFYVAIDFLRARPKWKVFETTERAGANGNAPPRRVFEVWRAGRLS